MVQPEQIKEWIEKGLPGARVSVSGDGRHFEAHVVYAGFKNQSTLQQHKMVYHTLGAKMQHTIHALSIKTTDH